MGLVWFGNLVGMYEFGRRAGFRAVYVSLEDSLIDLRLIPPVCAVHVHRPHKFLLPAPAETLPPQVRKLTAVCLYFGLSLLQVHLRDSQRSLLNTGPVVRQHGMLCHSWSGVELPISGALHGKC